MFRINEEESNSQAAPDSNMVASLGGYSLPDSWSPFSFAVVDVIPTDVLSALGFVPINSNSIVYVGKNAAPLFCRVLSENPVALNCPGPLPAVSLLALMSVVHPEVLVVRRPTRSTAVSFWSATLHPSDDAVPPTFSRSDPAPTSVLAARTNVVENPVLPCPGSSLAGCPPATADYSAIQSAASPPTYNVASASGFVNVGTKFGPPMNMASPAHSVMSALPWLQPNNPFPAAAPIHSVAMPSADDVNYLPPHPKRARMLDDMFLPDNFDGQETALTFHAVEFRSFHTANPHRLHAPISPPEPVNMALADPLEFIADFLRMAASLESYCFFSKSIVAIAKDPSQHPDSPDIAAAHLGRDFLLRHPASAPFARCEGLTLPTFLRSVYERFVAPRVGSHCAARIRVFKEDRTLPLSTVQTTFLRLAQSARDITTREARQLYVAGVENDEAARALRSWLVECALARRHVSLESTLTRHYQLCEHFMPHRTLPTQVSRVANISTATPGYVPNRVVTCWACGQPGHTFRQCPKGSRDGARQPLPFRSRGPRDRRPRGNNPSSASNPSDLPAGPIA